MVFSSATFVFVFLPAVLAAAWLAFQVGGRRSFHLTLLAASLIFYGSWRVEYVALMLFSIGVNFLFGRLLMRSRSRRHLFLGVAFNLILLGYYKYLGLFADTLTFLSGIDFSVGAIVLPLAISFHTFQQIAYLVDVQQGKVRETDFLHYCLYVMFFPQLVAGPIVHHAEMMPQFDRQRGGIQGRDLLIGLAIFVIGLYKKVVFADSMAVYADSVFANAGAAPTLLEAWAGALAYTFQIYFDFSGYSDMAIGLARMFGIRLPLNFDSPYKAASIIDFWRRWHMTLSRFLRDYLYFPLGGGRNGPWLRYRNLMIVMLLGGLWHGAAWTFAVWGGLHGFYLIVAHLWRGWRERRGGRRASAVGTWGGRLLTFLAVVVAWVFFRAASWPDAFAMLGGMAGLNGVTLPPAWAGPGGALAGLAAAGGLTVAPLRFVAEGVFPWFGLLLAIVWLAPNTQEIMARFEPALDIATRPAVRAGGAAAILMSPAWWAVAVPVAAVAGTVALLVVAARGATPAPFIYMFF